MWSAVTDAWTRIEASPEWQMATRAFNNSTDIYFIGNGGSMSTAMHAATDIMRVTTKQAHSPDSIVLQTALANDFGFETMFTHWLERLTRGAPSTTRLLVAFSASGRSANILHALSSASSRDITSILVTADETATNVQSFDSRIVLYVNALHYHHFEVLSLMLIYSLISSSGYECPRIKTSCLPENITRGSEDYR